MKLSPSRILSAARLGGLTLSIPSDGDRGIGPFAVSLIAGLALTGLFVQALPRETPARKAAVQRGRPAEVSVYSPKYHGRLTASGERFDYHQAGGFTAAVARVKTSRGYRPALPFGSRWLLKTGEGRSVVVRINDTGSWSPRKGHQWFDLPPAAWRKLFPGTAPGRRFDVTWQVMK